MGEVSPLHVQRLRLSLCALGMRSVRESFELLHGELIRNWDMYFASQEDGVAYLSQLACGVTLDYALEMLDVIEAAVDPSCLTVLEKVREMRRGIRAGNLSPATVGASSGHGAPPS